MYSEDELLLLSGLQHLAFCERQWALIHIEQTWEENRLTAGGRVLPERASANGRDAARSVGDARFARAFFAIGDIRADGRGRVCAGLGGGAGCRQLGIRGQKRLVEAATVPKLTCGETKVVAETGLRGPISARSWTQRRHNRT